MDELIIAEALRIRDVRQVGVARLAELANNERVVVGIDVDLRHGVVDGGVLAALLNTGFQPREDELESVPRLNLLHELVDGEVARHSGKQTLDGDGPTRKPKSRIRER
ncbi:hypothetical protein NUW54_g12658 [Trametes sanguinea]|uniref:Uncharacterized protein n=1 Tax=Trametes sanguinea TaxID=158606 RepID=A0ACC1MUV3_9APHY|nr:hypothetical protein NUW54_g12658 [Trametes sanguinea]